MLETRSDISEPRAPQSKTNGLFADHFRGIDAIRDFVVSGRLSRESGYFRLGPDIICFGQCSSGIPANAASDPLHDASQGIVTHGSLTDFPFDPLTILDNLLFERYLSSPNRRALWLSGNTFTRNMYYLVRPFMPIFLRKHLQKLYLSGRLETVFPEWPVDRTVERICERILVHWMKSRQIEKVPFIWFWPDGAPSCTILTHDVETEKGVQFCTQLMDLNDSFDIKSSFQLVPEGRYRVTPSLVRNIRARGFEVNLHDLNHDGHLMRDREQFLRRAEKINQYSKQYGTAGFRSAILYRNAEWHDALKFSFDMSIPNVAHLDPQRGGCCTVMPFFAGNILELPVTTTQDYTLFHILNTYSTELWKRQSELIREKHGLVSFIIHPDYIINRRARSVYIELLHYLAECRSQRQTWFALPGQAALWWRQRSNMRLVNQDGRWGIQGEGSERARIAYAAVIGDEVQYNVEENRISPLVAALGCDGRRHTSNDDHPPHPSPSQRSN